MKTKIMAGILAALLMVNGQAFGGECNVGKLEKTMITVFEAGATVTCASAAVAFGAICEGGTAPETLGLSTPGCYAATIGLDTVCTLFGVREVVNKAPAIAGDICDYAGNIDSAPFVLVRNKLKEHRVDFRVNIKHGDDVHHRGSDWLDPGKTSILSSNKMQTGTSYTVKAKVKIAGKSDVDLSIDGVKPDKYVVSVEYQDGEYKIHKEEKDFHKKNTAK